MDASIMNGKDMFSGAVTCIARLKNPISIARLVMEQTRHCLIVGSYAEELAKKHGFTLVDEKTLRTEEALEKLQKYIRRAAGEPIVKDTVSSNCFINNGDKNSQEIISLARLVQLPWIDSII